jgi:hypothetical protein
MRQRKRRADYFGVAPAARLKNLPEGHRPNRPFAKRPRSVIVLGMPIPQGVITAHRQLLKANAAKFFSSTALRVRKINDMLSTAAFRVDHRPDKTNRPKSPCPSRQGTHDEELYRGVLANRYAAVCARAWAQFVYSGFAATKADGPGSAGFPFCHRSRFALCPCGYRPRLCDPAACRVLC